MTMGWGLNETRPSEANPASGTWVFVYMRDYLGSGVKLDPLIQLI